MLTLYRRHNKTCSRPENDRTYTKCSCPIWVDGYLGGGRIRESLKTRNWQRATRRVTEAEAQGSWTVVEGFSVLTALEKWKQDAESRGLAPATRKKYRVLADQLAAFAGHLPLAGLTPDLLREFRAGWADAPLAATKKLERLRSFLRFCVDSGWLPTNPAARIRAPRITDPPTMPFTDDELERILASARERRGEHSERLPALLLVLQWTGLRIGDAVRLSVRDIEGDVLRMRTEKTGVTLRLPLPESVLTELGRLEPYRGEWYFWVGGSVETAAGNWRRTMRKVFEDAGIEGGHPHRYRDTFAVTLLRRGVSLEVVSKLLGHASIRITERHYYPWCRDLQEALERTVRSVW